jgi:hypothetical protein
MTTRCRVVCTDPRLSRHESTRHGGDLCKSRFGARTCGLATLCEQIISQHGVGGVVQCGALADGLPTEAWSGEAVRASALDALGYNTRAELMRNEEGEEKLVAILPNVGAPICSQHRGRRLVVRALPCAR